MPDIIDKLDWLSDVAERAETPPLFGRKEFFIRLRREAVEESLSLRLFTGMGALSAAAAGVVFFFAINAWTELGDPLARGIQTFLEVMP